MLNKINFQSSFVVFIVPLMMILSLFLLTKSTWFLSFPNELSLGITLDLVFIIPFLYFLIIRKRSIPKITVISVFLAGLVTASYMLPENQQFLLSQIKIYLFPIVELGVLSFLIFKIRKTVIAFRKLNNKNLDFFDAIQITCKKNFPKAIATLLATEIAVIYYGFFNWKKTILKENEFSNYLENGLIPVLLILVLIVFVEVFTLHSIIVKWNLILAWVLTVTSIYTALQIFALIKSLSKRPFIVDVLNKQVILRFGFFSKAVIPFKSIKDVIVSSKDLPEDKSITFFSPLGSLGGHNTIIHLENEIEFESFYGFNKQAKSFAISVDDKNKFIGLIKENTQC